MHTDKDKMYCAPKFQKTREFSSVSELFLRNTNRYSGYLWDKENLLWKEIYSMQIQLRIS